MRAIIIADNQDITNAGIKYILSQHNTPFQLLDAHNKKETIALLESNPDAITILDYTLFDFDSVNDLLVINERFKKAHWLLFAHELSLSLIKEVLYNSNSFSIIYKENTKEEVLSAIRIIEKGERYICSEVTNQLLTESNQHPSLGPSENETALTPTEKIILKEIASGKTTKEIALEKCLSFHTVNSHRKNIFRKIGANNIQEAIKYAFKAGIIDLTEYYI